MVDNLARGAFLLFLAVMIVAWALSGNTNHRPHPKANQVIGYLIS